MMERFSGFATLLGTSSSCVTVLVQTGANFGRVSLDRETAGRNFLWSAKEAMQPFKHRCTSQKTSQTKIRQNSFLLQRIKTLNPLLWNIRCRRLALSKGATVTCRDHRSTGLRPLKHRAQVATPRYEFSGKVYRLVGFVYV